MKLLPLEQEFLCWARRGIHFKRHLGSAILSHLCVRACVRACVFACVRVCVRACR